MQNKMATEVFIKKQVAVAAIRAATIVQHLKYGITATQALPNWVISELDEGNICLTQDSYLRLSTANGPVQAQSTDWIVQGVNGKIYPCPEDVFTQVYDLLVTKEEKVASTWKARIKAERDDLEERLSKLTAYLATPAFDAIGSIDQALLLDQRAAMSSYLGILDVRVHRSQSS